MTRQTLLPTLAAAVTAAAVVASGCATSVIDQPAGFSGPLSPTAIYAIDPGGGLAPVLLWASDSTMPASAKPPASYQRFKVEFNQPLDGTTVAKSFDFLGSTSALTFSFCAPISSSASLIDVDDTNRTIPAVSVCYDPETPVGGNPSITIIPGAGSLAAGSTTNAFTCQAFAAAPSSEQLKLNHKYAIKLGAIKGSHGNLLVIPSGGGWAADGSFSFTTDDFELMAIGWQSALNGFFFWGEKPYPGYQSFNLAHGPSAQVDCDFSSTGFSQQPCRIPPDGTPLYFYFSAPVDAASAAANITVTRVGGADPDSSVVVSGSTRLGRRVNINTGNSWEPNTQYTVTLKAGLKTTASTGTTLGADHVYTFTAGSGATPGDPQTVQILAVSPDVGATAIAIDPGTTSDVFLIASYPADVSGATITVKDSGGTVVSGTAAVVDGTAGQVIDIPITGTLKLATTYTVTATGIKVNSAVAGLPAGVGGKALDHAAWTVGSAGVSSTFTTQQFNAVALVDQGGNEVDGSTAVPPSYLVSGNIIAAFPVNADKTTLSNSTITISESDVALASYSVTPAADGSTATVQVTNSDFKLKYNTTYKVNLATTVKSGDGIALKKENCFGTDCSETLAFTTRPVGASLAIGSRATGAFTVSFSDAIDMTALTAYLNGTTGSFAIYPETVTINPVNGAHITSVDSSHPIPVTCTAAANNKSIACAPAAGALSANTYYLASATFYAVDTPGKGGPAKVLGPITVGSASYAVDPATSTFKGVLQAAFITPCP